MPQVGLQPWGRGQRWESGAGWQREQDWVQQGAGEPCRVQRHPHYRSSVGNPRLVVIISVFKGDGEDFR